MRNTRRNKGAEKKLLSSDKKLKHSGILNVFFKKLTTEQFSNIITI